MRHYEGICSQFADMCDSNWHKMVLPRAFWFSDSLHIGYSRNANITDGIFQCYFIYVLYLRRDWRFYYILTHYPGIVSWFRIFSNPFLVFDYVIICLIIIIILPLAAQFDGNLAYNLKRKQQERPMWILKYQNSSHWIVILIYMVNLYYLLRKLV